VVTNTGNITLTGVTVSDNSAVVGTCTPAQPSTLAPNGSMTCPATHLVTQTDVDSGSYVNTATGDSDQTTPNTSTVTITFPQNPAHTTVKSETSTGSYAVGDTITYNIVVTNMGNITLTDVTVADNNAVVGTCTPAQPSILAPNASMICPASHVVTQANVDSGSFVNSATGDSNQTPPNTSTVTVSFAQNPAHTTVKSETSTGPYALGDTITYNIVVTNTGNITLTGVTASDNSAVVGTCTPAQPSTLTPNAAMTCPASHVVTQTDINTGSYVNTATGDSNQTPPSTSTVAVNFAQNPVHTTVKTETSTGPYVVGNTITYNIVVTNTGNITLTGVTVTDNSAVVGTCTPTQPATLAPNASMICPASHVVTQADVDNGSYVNTATGDSDQTPPNSSTVTVNFPQTPAHTTVKTEASAGSYAVGDTITYDILVTNTGNLTLTGATVNDSSALVGTCTPAQPSTLAPNATMTCPASHVVTQADVDSGSYVNTATGDSDQTPPNTSTVTITFSQTPAHTTVKTETSTGPYIAGDTITYDIVVTNTGNVTLTNVTVIDNSAAVGTCTPIQPATLAPNATMTCPASHVVTQADVDNGSYLNAATGDSDQTPPNTSTVTITFPPTPVHTTVKTETSTGPYTVGDTITYSIAVTNTGNITLTGVTVTDNSAVVGTCTPAQPATLVPNATMTCPASHVVTQANVDSGSYVNTATGDSNQTTPNTSTMTVNFTQSPVHTTVKTETSTGPYIAGDIITYSIVVTNTGNITLTGVVVTDNNATLGVCAPAQPATLAPNATMTCSASHVVTATDISNGSFVNTATGDSNQTIPNTSTVTVNFAQTPAHTTMKTETSTGPYVVGNTITYDIVVTNTGNITLTGVTVTDNSAIVGVCTPAQPSTLAPNATMTCPASHVVTQADVDSGSYVNTATGDSDQTPPNSSTVTVNFPQNPTHATVKTETSTGPYAVGNTITYDIVVTNTGNITLTGVTVTDNSAVVGICTPPQPSTLAPNATMSCLATYVVTQADLDSGIYVNTATGDSDQTTPNISTVTVNLPQTPAHTTMKTETSTGPYVVGDTITYDIVVTNTGNVTLTGVTVMNSAVVGTCTRLKRHDDLSRESCGDASRCR
jgi:uncharacterized membrane protein